MYFYCKSDLVTKILTAFLNRSINIVVTVLWDWKLLLISTFPPKSSRRFHFFNKTIGKISTVLNTIKGLVALDQEYAERQNWKKSLLSEAGSIRCMEKMHLNENSSLYSSISAVSLTGWELKYYIFRPLWLTFCISALTFCSLSTVHVLYVNTHNFECIV